MDNLSSIEQLQELHTLGHVTLRKYPPGGYILEITPFKSIHERHRAYRYITSTAAQAVYFVWDQRHNL